MKKCIIVVSFGTADLRGIKDNIEKIEEDIRRAYGNEYLVLRAFTSNIIIRKLKEEYNIKIFNLREILDYLILNEYKEVLIQPLHIIPGKEYNKLIDICEEFGKNFKSLKLSTPLLTGNLKDYEMLVKAMGKEIPNDKSVVLVGHGSEHNYHRCYKELESEFINNNYRNIIMGTLEIYPKARDIVDTLKEKKIYDVYIMPFLLTCGGHVKRDISGNGTSSWKSVFRDNGIKSEVVLKGLGEYEGIRNMFITKLDKIINE